MLHVRRINIQYKIGRVCMDFLEMYTLIMIQKCSYDTLYLQFKHIFHNLADDFENEHIHDKLDYVHDTQVEDYNN